MSLNWDHHFCLACDTQTDGPPYCSEHCRLADFETSTAPSTPNSSSSPTRAYIPSSPVALSQQQMPQEQLQLQQPPWKRSNPSIASSTFSPAPLLIPQPRAAPVPLSQRALWNPFEERSYYAPPATARPHILSPSSSRTSLSSIRSTSSSGSGTAMVSEKAAKELREYARSFESARSQRRRSK
jgi:hypothetical protein